MGSNKKCNSTNSNIKNKEEKSKSKQCHYHIFLQKPDNIKLTEKSANSAAAKNDTLSTPNKLF